MSLPHRPLSLCIWLGSLALFAGSAPVSLEIVPRVTSLFETADLVFRGERVGDCTPTGKQSTQRFLVLSTYKGPSITEISLSTVPLGCDVSTFVLFLRRTGGGDGWECIQEKFCIWPTRAGVASQPHSDAKSLLVEDVASGLVEQNRRSLLSDLHFLEGVDEINKGIAIKISPFITSKDMDIALAAAGALARTGKQEDAERLASLVANWRRGGDYEEMHAALEFFILNIRPEYLHAFERLTSSEIMIARLAGIDGLIRLGDRSSVAYVGPMLYDNDDFLRYEAVRFLQTTFSIGAKKCAALGEYDRSEATCLADARNWWETVGRVKYSRVPYLP